MSSSVILETTGSQDFEMECDKLEKIAKETLTMLDFKFLKCYVIKNRAKPIIVVDAYRFRDKLRLEGNLEITVIERAYSYNYVYRRSYYYTLAVSFGKIN